MLKNGFYDGFVLFGFCSIGIWGKFLMPGRSAFFPEWTPNLKLLFYNPNQLQNFVKISKSNVYICSNVQQCFRSIFKVGLIEKIPLHTYHLYHNFIDFLL